MYVQILRLLAYGIHFLFVIGKYACTSWALGGWMPNLLFVTGNTKTGVEGKVPVEELW